MKSCRPVIALLSTLIAELSNFKTFSLHLFTFPRFSFLFSVLELRNWTQHQFSLATFFTEDQRRALHLMVECRLNFENQSSHLGKKRANSLTPILMQSAARWGKRNAMWIGLWIMDQFAYFQKFLQLQIYTFKKKYLPIQFKECLSYFMTFVSFYV